MIPYELAVDPAAWDARWRADPPPVPLARDYPERRLERLAARLEIPISPLLERFERERARVLPYLKYHLNPDGHEIAAQAILELLVETGLVRLQAGSAQRPG